jgi:hypothetical protein
MEHPITVDGMLDEKAWEGVPEATGFSYHYNLDAYVPLQTSFKMGYTDERLYVAMRADEPLMKEHLENYREKRDVGKFTWAGWPLMIVWLDVPIDGQTRHYAFGEDLLGRKGWKRAVPGQDPRERANWTDAPEEFPWTCAVHHGEDFFSMEMALGLEGFGVTPDEGDQWGCQVTRHGTCWPRAEVLQGLHWRTANYTDWSRSPNMPWRHPEQHGTFVFSAEALPPGGEAVQKATEHINADFFRWKVNYWEVVRDARALLKRVKARPNLCRPEQKDLRPRATVFGARRGMPPRDVPNWTHYWHFALGLTQDPHTVTVEWPEPVTFNAMWIEWHNPEKRARDYMLEYRDGDRWRTAFKETGHEVSVSCHVFPEVETDAVRLTLADYVGSRNVVISDLGLFRVPPAEDQPE